MKLKCSSLQKSKWNVPIIDLITIKKVKIKIIYKKYLLKKKKKKRGGGGGGRGKKKEAEATDTQNKSATKQKRELSRGHKAGVVDG